MSSTAIAAHSPLPNNVADRRLLCSSSTPTTSISTADKSEQHRPSTPTTSSPTTDADLYHSSATSRFLLSPPSLIVAGRTSLHFRRPHPPSSPPVSTADRVLSPSVVGAVFDADRTIVQLADRRQVHYFYPTALSLSFLPSPFSLSTH